MAVDKDLAADADWVLWPCSQVACRIGGSGGGGGAHGTPGVAGAGSCLTQGKAFATLSTGISTGYPVHVNARWRLTNNRNALIHSSRSNQVYNKWNRLLISDPIASLWSELLVELTRNADLNATTFYSLWQVLSAHRFTSPPPAACTNPGTDASRIAPPQQ